MTLADLVRGRTSKRPRTVREHPHSLIRLVRPYPVIPPDVSVELTPLAPESGSREVPFGDLGASKKVFQRAVAFTEEVLRAIRARTSFSVTSLETAHGELLESLRTSDALLLPFFSPGGGSASPAEKAVNVCILSLKIGMQLNYAPDALQSLGLAALLNEAGVAQTQKGGAREHAHIVTLASLFESLAHRRPARSGFWPSEAIKELLQRERGTFPDHILKALIRILTTLPVGCLVRLNTGEICRVATKNDCFLLRPLVVVLVRRGKRPTEPTRIDLSQNPFLHILGFVAEEMLDQEVGRAET